MAGLLLGQVPKGVNPGVSFTDITSSSGIAFRHNSGASGKKYLPETMGGGAAFFDYDQDGWSDLLLISGTNWTAPKGASLALYRNQNGSFRDVTAGSGLDVPLHGLGVATGDFDNDGLVDVYVTTYGQNRLFRNVGKGKFRDVTDLTGLGKHNGFSTSAAFLDFDRDGYLDLFVCNYVRWNPESDIFCTLDGKTKSYCTPEAYRGASSWLFHNKRDGTFEEVTVKAGLLDISSKSLGVTILDYDGDQWPDLFVANDTQPNKLYRNQRDGTFRELAVQAGVAFGEDGKARAGMGVDAADIDGSGRTSVLVTNFQNEKLGLYRMTRDGSFADIAATGELGRQTGDSLGFGCFFFDVDLDGRIDIFVANGHIDESIERARAGVKYAQPPQLFWNQGRDRFVNITSQLGGGLATPKVGRGATYADIDLDGDLDVLMTTSNGPVHLYRNDQKNSHSSLRIALRGSKSNRDAIGAVVEIFVGKERSTRLVKSALSYLSQAELPLTVGLGAAGKIDKLVIRWPSGRIEERTNLTAGRSYVINEGGDMTSVALRK